MLVLIFNKRPLIKDGVLSVTYVPVTPQIAGSDCGVFSVAYLVQLLHTREDPDFNHPEKFHYSQHTMRQHLLQCIVEQEFSPFPGEYNDKSYGPSEQIEIPVSCACGRPDIWRGGAMIQCCQCMCWLHWFCERITNEKECNGHWICSKCKSGELSFDLFFFFFMDLGLV